MAKVLALDVGERKIGVATGDTIFTMAFTRPALMIHKRADAWPKIRAVVADEQIDRIVVGWPVGTNGIAGAQAEAMKEFITDLEREIGLPVEIRDERFTSQAVIREQREAGRKLKRGEEDSLAAQLLLEAYFVEQTRE